MYLGAPASPNIFMKYGRRMVRRPERKNHFVSTCWQHVRLAESTQAKSVSGYSQAKEFGG